VFPSPRGNRELHLLDKCKAVAERAKLSPAHFHLRKFRATYATRMLRSGFDVRTVQHWMGHKSLETTMRYLRRPRMCTTGWTKSRSRDYWARADIYKKDPLLSRHYGRERAIPTGLFCHFELCAFALATTLIPYPVSAHCC